MTDVLTVPVNAAADELPRVGDHAWWVGGLTLAERCALPGHPSWPVPADRAERARQRLARWREVDWLAGHGQAANRPSTARLTELELLALLSEEPAACAARTERPDWAQRIEEIVLDQPEGPPLTQPADDVAAATVGLAAIMEPFSRSAVDHLVAALPAGAADVAALGAGLVFDLERTLVQLAGRALVLDLQVRRHNGQLAGDTPRQRFWSFVRQLRQPAGLAELCGEYPVLARLLVSATDRAATKWAQLGSRLIADRSRLAQSASGGADLGWLVMAEAAGDGFDSADAVVLRFATGVAWVYRPFPVTADERFAELVGWLARRLPDLAPNTPKLVERGEYGWLGHVEPTPPTSRAEQRQCYRRWGALLALLHAVGGADLPSSAVALAGDQVVAADLTRLFCPALPIQQLGGARDPARAVLAASVRRINQLPPTTGSVETQPTGACSGSGGPPERLPAYPMLRWAAPGTDQMCLVPAAAAEGRAYLPAPEHEQLVDALTAGFGAAYEALAAGSAELTGTGGLLHRFAGAAIQFPLRTVAACRVMLAESTHPDLLRDGLERERVLSSRWALPLSDPAWHPLAAAELDDLRDGIGPRLRASAGSTDVVTGAGTVLRNPSAETGLAKALARVRAMGRADLVVQERILRAWLAQYAGPASPAERVSPSRSAGDAPVDPERCLRIAGQLADRLSELAYRQGGQAAWLDLTTSDCRSWRLQPAGIGLGSGFPGVALFLAKLSELTGHERHATLARQAMASVQAVLERPELAAGERPRCGPFHGICGLGYALVQLAASLRDPTLLAGTLPPILAAVMATSDAELDVLGGQAGCAVALLAVDAAVGSHPALRVAQVAIRQLIRTWLPGQGEGTSPGRPRSNTARLPAGFARGAAGIGWALLRYGAVTGDQAARTAGLAAMDYQRALGSPTGAGWCEGAAGVALAHLDSQLAATSAVEGEIERAVRAVVSTGPLPDHSLCHGEAGSLEMLTIAVESGHGALAAERDRRADRLLTELEQTGPRCGTPRGLVTPGLLTGLAGIGYGVLRLGFPDRVPSVLLLRPPVDGGSR